MVLQCLLYNYNNTGTCKDSYDKCSIPIECPEQHHCFVVWQLEPTNEPKIVSSGCNPPYNSTPSENCSTECIGQPKGVRFYCCCTGHLCNQRVITPLPLSSTTPPPVPMQSPSPSSLWLVIPIVLIITTILAYALRHKFVRYKDNNRNRNGSRCSSLEQNERNNSININNLNDRELNQLRNDQDVTVLMSFRNSFQDDQSYRNNNKNQRSSKFMQVHHNETINSSSRGQNDMINNNCNSNHDTGFDLNNVQLSEIVGSGRFGTVHRASSKDFSEIAVKIIPLSEQQSWFNEQQIYSLPKLRHPNILEYLGSGIHIETDSCWLVVEFASKGSLYGYLKDETIDFKTFLRLALGIAHGLSHLHDTDIAHRDFKSKNVLLKNDLTPCITDFGVATILDASSGSHQDQRKKFLQVGTPRYMAPEVLECSVTFTKSSFTKIDVYALSLVLWELLSRCSECPQPYKLPFEDIVGKNPDINTMRQVVVVEKLRPAFQPEWRAFPDVCRAIEDGWEYDHDARISASCFVERVESIVNN